MRDVADLIPAARAAHAALAASGRRLSLDAPTDRMRDDGHAVSNARVCLLVKILRAEDSVTTLGPAESSGTGEAAESPNLAA